MPAAVVIPVGGCTASSLGSAVSGGQAALPLAGAHRGIAPWMAVARPDDVLVQVPLEAQQPLALLLGELGGRGVLRLVGRLVGRLGVLGHGWSFAVGRMLLLPASLSGAGTATRTTPKYPGLDVAVTDWHARVTQLTSCPFLAPVPVHRGSGVPP